MIAREYLGTIDSKILFLPYGGQILISFNGVINIFNMHLSRLPKILLTLADDAAKPQQLAAKQNNSLPSLKLVLLHKDNSINTSFPP